MKKQTGSPRERIVNTASELFYKHGYRATGINEVIEKSGVAKATFYNHFPTKDDLCMAYLEGVVEKELNMLDGTLSKLKDPKRRFLAVIEWLRPWLVETGFRGCAFLHAVAEIPDAQNPLRSQGVRLYSGVKKRVEKLCEELIASDKKKYKTLDAKKLTEDYMLIFAGTIALAEIYNKEWPVDHGLSTLKRLIGE